MFEYKVVAIERNDGEEKLEQALNEFGKEGWELVTIEGYSKPGLTQVVIQASTTTGFVLILKRKKG